MGIFSKGTKMYSILHMKCPHCQEGEFFESRNPYNLKKAGNILDECPVCHRKLSKEPGFYYGAMYVAYGLGVAVFVTVLVATVVLYPQAPDWVYIALTVLVLFFGGPFFYALSKIIWANLFFRYKGVERTEKELADLKQHKHA